MDCYFQVNVKQIMRRKKYYVCHLPKCLCDPRTTYCRVSWQSHRSEDDKSDAHLTQEHGESKAEKSGAVCSKHREPQWVGDCCWCYSSVTIKQGTKEEYVSRYTWEPIGPRARLMRRRTPKLIPLHTSLTLTSTQTPVPPAHRGACKGKDGIKATPHEKKAQNEANHKKQPFMWVI